MCTGRKFKDNACLVALKGTRLLRQESAENKKDLLPAPRALCRLYGLFRPSKIFPRSVSKRRLHERTSGSRDDGTRLINTAASRGYHIRPSSDDIVKPLSTYGH
ncbi:hypothetical protein DPMN_015532 [Dreissena polymorpha]|uniref:Uncharacterized protein n=1 Tax=Dreissena polymorpha TaxID=45954 RepID=A0A9D4NBR0_DREPO|nr:hypothetical protein DPMN_015532 [Dreissena polymorpha]